MKKLQRLIIAVLVTALIVGSTSTGFKREITAQAKSSTFLLKAAPDFKLRLPNSWKDKYVVKKSKGRKAGSYVAFYAKKCYRQTGEGWLFSIARYKDTSYEEM